MKDQFIEKDGLLFMKCEPEPLEIDSKMPCMVKLIRYGRIGKFNEATNSFTFRNDIMQLIYKPNDLMGAGYLLHEIIATHCPEGSREWALWQMLNGKNVKHERDTTNYYYMNENGMLVNKGGQIMLSLISLIEDESQWLKTSSRNGWQIYEEPKPKPEVGKWYRQLDEPYHYQCTRINKDGFDVRKAGDEHVISLPHTLMEEFWETFIEPDFSNAKVCDYAFSTIQGSETIGRIDVKDGSRKIINDCYEVDGRFAPLDEHPVLFHSAAQCAAYFAEVALKERGGE